MNEVAISKFRQFLLDEQIKLNEPMKNHTTFKTGGNADIFLVPHNAEQIKKIIQICKDENIETFILGNGSNVLVRDNGFRGVIVSIGKNMSTVEIINDNQIRSQAGALLSYVANIALKNSLEGFEFASGIPGSIGGAAYMNAGAYGGEMKDVFVSAEVLTEKGEVKTLLDSEIDFGYRKSRIQKEKMLVLSVTIQLQKGDYNKIKNEILELNKKRADKQPIEKPSAGSTFKRPEGYFAGKLIMDSGLRGYSIGGAQISEKHCGFIVNNVGATAKDITDLIDYTKKSVLEKFDVVLEPEVCVIGQK